MKNVNWKYVIFEIVVISQLKTASATGEHLASLSTKERMKENSQIEEQDYSKAYEELKNRLVLEVPSPHNKWWRQNTFMFPIEKSTINKWYNNRLMRAMQLGQKLVFDCSYDLYMTRREASITAKQLMLCFCLNRRHKDPFDFHFCNAIPSSNIMKDLKQLIPTVRNTEFPLNLHEESFMDLFPKEQLVYLTPHCQVDLVEYDPNCIYIVGAMVDKMNPQPVSLIKARSSGLRMARLPLDRYLKWSGASRNLTLNQMTKIMLDIKTTRDWSYSLKHVPTSKVN